MKRFRMFFLFIGLFYIGLSSGIAKVPQGTGIAETAPQITDPGLGTATLEGRGTVTQKRLYLKLFPPDQTGLKRIAVSAKDIEAIVFGFGADNMEAAIEFSDMYGDPLANIGRINNGRIYWKTKPGRDSLIALKFNKKTFTKIMHQIEQEDPEPGYRIQLTRYVKKFKKKQAFLYKPKYDESTSTQYIRELSFQAVVDFGVGMSFPGQIKVGEDLSQKITVTLKNTGTVGGGPVWVHVIISKDTDIPLKPALYSETFQEDCLFFGGKFEIQHIAGGETLTFRLKGPLTVPKGIPPGRCYIGVVTDPESRFKEINKKNNTVAYGTFIE